MKVFKNVMILVLIVVLIVAISFVVFSYVTLNNDGIQSEELINHQYLSINEDYKLSIFQSSAIYELNLEDMVDMSTHQFDFSKLETNDEKIAEEMDILFRTQNAKQLELEIETEDNTSKLTKKIEELKKTKQEGKGREMC